MAKSMRSKREKRLRAIRREMVEPLYEKKEQAKLAAQEAALNAPKLPVRTSSSTMDITVTTSTGNNNDMDVEMAINDSMKALKPMGKKMKKKLKLAKRNSYKKGGKASIRKKRV